MFVSLSVKCEFNLSFCVLVNDDDDVHISGPVVFEQYIVVADHKKKNKNDISLTAGDTVDVIERNDYGEKNADSTNIRNTYNI